MNTFPQEEVITAILVGIVNAHNTNKKWAKGAWLSMAPEYMLNIFIGQEFAKLQNKPNIWFEVSIPDLADSIGFDENDPNKPKEAFINCIQRNNYKNEKIDIVLDTGDVSKVLIEVKNAVTKYDVLENDVIRLCDAMKHKSQLEYGVIAFYANVNSKKKIENLIQEIEDGIERTVQKGNYKIKPINLTNYINIDRDKVDGWSCAAISFVLESY
ncbi:MAG: hypothetical protein Q8M43_08955 [Sulfuricurvum sp.]|uniref:hypothetical protein n=1 Tax=Sulfuricurvum sp. TaxID=2025608 RepID=UPI00273526E5|nr:hypothetical protein [Sulfuricurvum sp.]MDP3292147.1 hypothetical protein [Sulfuricurvum sp.]